MIDLSIIKTYLEHALDELIELEGNPYEAQEDIKDALAYIRKIEEGKNPYLKE